MPFDPKGKIAWDGEKAEILGYEITGIPGFLIAVPLCILIAIPMLLVVIILLFVGLLAYPFQKKKKKK